MSDFIIDENNTDVLRARVLVLEVNYFVQYFWSYDLLIFMSFASLYVHNSSSNISLLSSKVKNNFEFGLASCNIRNTIYPIPHGLLSVYVLCYTWNLNFWQTKFWTDFLDSCFLFWLIHMLILLCGLPFGFPEGHCGHFIWSLGCIIWFLSLIRLFLGYLYS